MNTIKCLLALGVGLLTALPSVAQPTAKTYQVTGPIVALTATTITIEKNGEHWEIARAAETKNADDLKIGQKVLVRYRMTAMEVEVKERSGQVPNKDEKKRDDAAHPVARAARNATNGARGN